MSTPNFGAILDTAPSEIEKPKPLPQGTYTCVVKGLPKFDKSSKKQTEYAEFTYQILSADDDVDQDELKAMGGIGDKTMRDTYYLTENALWRLKEMLKNCGLEEDEYESLREMLEAAPGCQLKVFVKHEPSADGSTVYANVGRTLPMGD